MSKEKPPAGAAVPRYPEALSEYMSAKTGLERDAAFLRMYSDKVLNRTAILWEIPNTVATTLGDIAKRIMERVADQDAALRAKDARIAELEAAMAGTYAAPGTAQLVTDLSFARAALLQSDHVVAELDASLTAAHQRIAALEAGNGRCVAALREVEAFTRAYQCVDEEETDDWTKMRHIVEATLDSYEHRRPDGAGPSTSRTIGERDSTVVPLDPDAGSTPADALTLQASLTAAVRERDEARDWIAQVLFDYQNDLTKAACDACEQCSAGVMCSFHSLLSVLSKRTMPYAAPLRIHELEAKLEAAERTCAALRHAVLPYIEWHGGAHEAECPKDDTCDCAGMVINDALNKALRDIPEPPPPPRRSHES